MYSKKSNLIIGFHGCDKSIRDAVINGAELKPSVNDYDWLGNGIYFWEADPIRAMEWAEQASKRESSTVKEPAVIGAVIDLGNCLDLMNRESVQVLKLGYEWLKLSQNKEGVELPRNSNIKDNSDLLIRNLDCAVIQKIHEVTTCYIDKNISSYDSVRGLFVEGKEVYEGAGFRDKTHIQLCVVNPNCIKGYFLPREINYNFRKL